MLGFLLVVAVVVPASMLIQAMAVALAAWFVEGLVRLGFAGPDFFRNVGVAMGVIVILMLALLTQVGLWALAFVICGALPDFATAFYQSAVNFTTLGCGDIVMAPEWRLLGPLEAANGVLMFGVSASAMFTVSGRLLELRHKRHHKDSRS